MKVYHCMQRIFHSYSLDTNNDEQTDSIIESKGFKIDLKEIRCVYNGDWLLDQVCLSHVGHIKSYSSHISLLTT